MSRHLALVPAPTERELPVAWDGVPITWPDEPTPAGAVFICPPPKEPARCSACGQLQADGADIYVGRVPELLAEHWTRDRAGRPLRVPAREALRPRLVLTRCLGCWHDQVTDLDTDEQWDLDDSDYGPEGSVHPDDVQGRLW